MPWGFFRRERNPGPATAAPPLPATVDCPEQVRSKPAGIMTIIIIIIVIIINIRVKMIIIIIKE